MDLYHLDFAEKQILIQTLESVISELSMEITHTDLKDYRDDLKHRKTVLNKTVHILKEDRTQDMH